MPLRASQRSRTGLTGHQGFRYPAYAFDLIGSTGDVDIDIRLANVFAGLTLLDHPLQLVLGMKSIHAPGRAIEDIIPEKGSVSIGVIDDGTPAMHAFYCVCI